MCLPISDDHEAGGVVDVDNDNEDLSFHADATKNKKPNHNTATLVDKHCEDQRVPKNKKKISTSKVSERKMLYKNEFSS